MGRILRIVAILLIALIGAVASFLVFAIIRYLFTQTIISLTREDGLVVLICGMIDTAAILAIVFHTKVLSLLGNRDEYSNADIVDQQTGEDLKPNFGFLQNLHWVFWSGNFAFAIGIICFSIYVLNNYLDFMPLAELPHGWERYTLLMIVLMLGITLVIDALTLLRNYISERRNTSAITKF